MTSSEEQEPRLRRRRRTGAAAAAASSPPVYEEWRAPAAAAAPSLEAQLRQSPVYAPPQTVRGMFSGGIILSAIEAGMMFAVTLTYYLADGAGTEGYLILLNAVHMMTWVMNLYSHFVVNYYEFVLAASTANVVAFICDGLALGFRIGTFPETYRVGFTLRTILGGGLALVSLAQVVATGFAEVRVRNEHRKFLDVVGWVHHHHLEHDGKDDIAAMRLRNLDWTTITLMSFLHFLSTMDFAITRAGFFLFIIGFYSFYDWVISPAVFFMGHIFLAVIARATTRGSRSPRYPPRVVRGTQGIVLALILYPAVFAADVSGLVFHLYVWHTLGTRITDLTFLTDFLAILPSLWFAVFVVLTVFCFLEGVTALLIQSRLRQQGRLLRSDKAPIVWAD